MGTMQTIRYLQARDIDDVCKQLRKIYEEGDPTVRWPIKSIKKIVQDPDCTRMVEEIHTLDDCYEFILLTGAGEAMPNIHIGWWSFLENESLPG